MMLNFSKKKHGNELLSILLSADSYVSADLLQQQLHISRRSLFYLISKVNTELDNQAKFPITNVKKLGYYLPKDTVQFLQNFSNEKNCMYIEYGSIDQRQNLIIFSILSANGRSLFDLSGQFNVSKNTVIRDMKLVYKKLQKYHLQLRNTLYGKIITGAPINVRKWVYDHVNQLYPLINEHFIPTVKVKIIQSQLRLFERITGKYLTDDAHAMLLLFLQWHLGQIKYKYRRLGLTKVNYDNFNLDFIWAKSFLRDCDIENNSEANYLVKLINSSQFSHVSWDNPMIQQLKPFAVRMVADFNYLTDSHIGIKTISDSLTVHLLSTYYRKKYAMSFIYPGLNKFKQYYCHTFKITRKVVIPFEKFMGCSLSDDEIALIAIYFGGAIREQRLHLVTQDEVLVVCSSGIGTSRLLLKQLRTRYRNVQFSTSINVLQYENYDLKYVRLVLSTIRLHSRNSVPVVTVSALPSTLEWKIIDNAIIKAGLATTVSLKPFDINVLLDIIENHAMVIDPVGLKEALKSYSKQLIQIPNTINTYENSSELIKLLPPHHVGFLAHPKSWKQAVRTALSPLIEDYSVEKSYIDRIISLTESNGPYMAIGSGIMLAHAGPRDGVNSLGATFFLVDKPISIMNSSKQIKLIIGLAPIDRKKHLVFITDLMKQLQKQDWLNQLYKVKNRDELLHYLSDLKKKGVCLIRHILW